MLDGKQVEQFIWGPHRSLVLVPKSHEDGTHEVLRPPGDYTPTTSNSLQFTLTGRAKEGLVSAEAMDDIVRRAAFVDVRRRGQRSAWLVWDSRCIHQGYTWTQASEAPEAFEAQVDAMDCDTQKRAALDGEKEEAPQNENHEKNAKAAAKAAKTAKAAKAAKTKTKAKAKKSKAAFAPQRIHPPIFAPTASEGEEGWRAHLKEHGYAVVGHVLDDADVDTAVEMLRADLTQMNHRSEGGEGDDKLAWASINDSHLPAHSNSGLRHRGLPHGEFAWYLRDHARVRALWETLYPVEDRAGATHLVGCPATVALTAPDPPLQPGATPTPMSAKFEQFVRGQWLHLDYSPPKQHRMYQSTLYLFPGEKAGETADQKAGEAAHPAHQGPPSEAAHQGPPSEAAHPWPRIGLMVSMAPASSPYHGTRSDSTTSGEMVRARLLAACIIGAAGKCPAGLAFGHLQKIAEGYGKKGQTRLVPTLRSGLRDDEVMRMSGGRWESVKALQRVRMGATGEEAKVKELVDVLGVDKLRLVAHPRAVRYICGPS
jgi:hypothetical protein